MTFGLWMTIGAVIQFVALVTNDRIMETLRKLCKPYSNNNGSDRFIGFVLFFVGYVVDAILWPKVIVAMIVDYFHK